MGRQSKHSQNLRRSAGGYKSKGYHVEADIPGYRRPPLLKVDGKSVRPDIIAYKGKRTRKIVEIETPESFDKDKEQRRLLRKYARSHAYTTFRTTTTD